MTIDFQGVRAPSGSDPFNPDGDMRAMRSSLAGRLIIPVANEDDRDAKAQEANPSSDNPFYVHRANAPAHRRTEWTEDGVTWNALYSDSDDWESCTIVGSVAAGSYLNVRLFGPFAVLWGWIQRSNGAYPASGEVVARLPSAKYRPPGQARRPLMGYGSTSANLLFLTANTDTNDLRLTGVGTSTSDAWITGSMWPVQGR